MGQGVGVGSIMWLALSDGWLRIVSHRYYPEMLLVCARRSKHITELFPDTEVYSDSSADYPYRANINREEVGNVIHNYTVSIDYDKYKPSIEDEDLYDSIGQVWRIMYSYGLPYRPNSTNTKLIDNTGGI